MHSIIERIGLMGLFPAISVGDAELAVPAAKALIDGGLDVLEITLRTEQALDAIRRIKEEYPGLLLGAGTVLSSEKAKEAVKAGAQFIVAPGFNPEMVQWCIDNHIVVIPGCATPSEVEQALRYGINTFKFFPANLYGGVQGCKALAGPFKKIKIIPMGGVDLNNMFEYADKPFIHAIGGSFLCKTSDINAKNFSKITEGIKEAIDTLLGFEFAHIGINMGSRDESIEVADMFSKGFKWPIKHGSSSNFVGKSIEISTIGLGAKGHIAIRTNNIGRAVYYLEKRGLEMDWSTRKGTEDTISAVYLKDGFGGFAVHLLQK